MRKADVLTFVEWIGGDLSLPLHNITVIDLPESERQVEQDGTSYLRYGYAEEHGDGTYTVAINPDLEVMAAIRTIAHEVRHVWQYHTGRLVERNGMPMYRTKAGWQPDGDRYEDQFSEFDANAFAQWWIERNWA